MNRQSKLIIVAVDGSEDALRSLDYLDLIYGAKETVEVQLLYILPSLPPILVVDQNRQSKMRLLDIEKKNLQLAEQIVTEAKDILLNKGFQEEHIKGVYRKKQIGIAQDICNFAGDKGADALLVTRRGRSRLDAFLSGEISSKILDYCLTCPVWVVEGGVQSKQVLIAMDSSENGIRAADHAGFMLAGTDCQVTLFHSKRHLRRFVPQEVIEAAPELEELWRNKAGEQIGPFIEKGKDLLIQAGLREEQIRTKVVDGSRSEAADILKETRSNNFGTIVLGRKGHSSVKEYLMGSTTSKVLQDSGDLAVWVVH
ncbi:MAG: universal stress protein [Deltaproteobacteria bacterium]|nr:MAG: universal stress protein [Deltaproteobacteria bacterium]